MSQEKEYIVTLNKDVDFDQFNQDMIKSTGDGNIPQRTVDIADKRPLSQRNTHYALTAQEAEQLKNDPRVLDVDIRPDQNPNIQIGTAYLREANFNKSTSESGNYRDWGKIRHSYSGGLDNSFYQNNNWPYAMDGTGVDIVIQDSGLQVNHPEFNDYNGVSRVQQIDWYNASGLSGSQSSNHYRDFDGHGTHCAGTAAGLTFGWAPNARVFSVKVRGLEGSGDGSTGIPISQCFDVIKGWHNNKPIDPLTGYRRPTIVNMSWGYTGFLSNTIDSISYRGTTYNTSNDASFNSSNNRWTQYGLVPLQRSGQWTHKLRITSVDTDVDELIAAGVHVCIAAGNAYTRIDAPGGDDYNNIVFGGNGSSAFYHRGSSPFSYDANMVGNINSSRLGSTERKANTSDSGPGVNIYAAGTNIISATSSTNRFSDAAYHANSSFRQCNISGTSMASPQICGIGAMHLQANPNLTPAQLIDRINNDAIPNFLNNTGDTAYTDQDNAMGGQRRVAQNRYNKSRPFNSNIIAMKRKR